LTNQKIGIKNGRVCKRINLFLLLLGFRNTILRSVVQTICSFTIGGSFAIIAVTRCFASFASFAIFAAIFPFGSFSFGSFSFGSLSLSVFSFRWCRRITSRRISTRSRSWGRTRFVCCRRRQTNATLFRSIFRNIDTEITIEGRGELSSQWILNWKETGLLTQTKRHQKKDRERGIETK